MSEGVPAPVAATAEMKVGPELRQDIRSTPERVRSSVEGRSGH